MRFKTSCKLAAVAFVGLVLGLSSGAPAILAEDYVAIRILEPPSPHPPEDCIDFVLAKFGQDCGAGPAFPAGISNAGDVAGHIETNFPHVHHNEEAIRWLRSTGYTGENVHRYEIHPDEVPRDGEIFPGGRAHGVHSRFVSSSGIMVGDSNVDNAHKYAYDIVNDQWWDFGHGSGIGANNHGLILGREESCCGGRSAGYYARVSDTSLVEPFPSALQKIDERGEVHRIDANLASGAINDAGIIVGTVDGNPVRILPLAESAGEGGQKWGAPMVMNQSGPAFAPSSVRALSDTDPPYAVGQSTAGDFQTHGVVWNVDDGTIIQELGVLAEPSSINAEGTIIAGTVRAFGFPLPPQEPVLWTSDDGWATFEQINLNDLLASVPGGEVFDHLLNVRGVNDQGQIVGVAVLKGEFGALIDPTVTDWPKDLALCDVISKGGCGVPYLLDTMPLDGGQILTGDVNNDAAINNLDITPFIKALEASGDEGTFLTQVENGCFACADVNMDDAVNNLDITPFIGLLQAPAATGAAPVPEPASAALLLLAMVTMGRRRGISISCQRSAVSQRAVTLCGAKGLESTELISAGGIVVAATRRGHERSW